jgi:hypothetical protein
MLLRCLASLLLAAAASSAHAGAWTKPKGKGQAILKADVMQASRGYDSKGGLLALPETRTDRSVGLLVEYGLTDRLTAQFKGDWQSGEDAFVDYSGRGPTEIGFAWQAYRDDRYAVSLYAGYAISGEGRNAGYAAPGAGEQDWEFRTSVGRSFVGPEGGWAGRLGPDRAFVEVQMARRLRDGLPHETRADVTIGGHYGANWMVLGQAFGGMTDGNGPRWLSIETSVVRTVGRWSFQAGWRRTVAGRETPLAQGPVIAVWRRF